MNDSFMKVSSYYTTLDMVQAAVTITKHIMLHFVICLDVAFSYALY